MKKLLPFAVSLALGGFSSWAVADDLAQIYQQAKQNDPQLLQAEARKNAAFESIDANRAALLPQISLKAGYNISRNSDIDSRDTNTLSGSINLNQQLFEQSSWINRDIAEINYRQVDAVYAATQQVDPPRCPGLF